MREVTVEEPIPRRIIAVILIVTGILGAVEATPKEVVVSLSVDPAAASPLNTLPTGSSELARLLREAGYDVRIYGDATDLAADAPKRLALIVVSPERVPEAQARIAASVLEKAEEAVLVVLDERPVETGSAYLMGMLAPTACRGVSVPLAQPEAKPATLIFKGGDSVGLLHVPAYTPLRLPPVEAPYPPMPPVAVNVGVEVVAFASPDGRTWAPAGFRCAASPTHRLVFMGTGYPARNAVIEDDAVRGALLGLIMEAAGPPETGVVVAFVVGFYVGGSVSLATAIHPSYILTLAAQAYVAVEPSLMAKLHGAKWAAIVAGAVLLAATTVAREALRLARPASPSAEGKRRDWLEALCIADPAAAPCRGGMLGMLARLYYRLSDSRRAYLERLARERGGGSGRGAWGA